jgi:hypothetical protein
MSINKLPFIDMQPHQRYLPNAFDEELTILQKLNKLVVFMNDVITHANSITNLTEEQRLRVDELSLSFENFKADLENTLLPAGLTTILDDWFVSGKLSEIINDQVFDMKADTTYVNDIFATITKYPVIALEGSMVTRKYLPYCHVERYGADPTWVNDSSTAFQFAFDLAERLASGTEEIPAYPVRAGVGTYKITKTIKLKYDASWQKESRPISFIGAPIHMYYSNPPKGTVIKPLIPNHTLRDYANLFSINIKYLNDTDTDDTATFGGGTGAPIMNNISFENLTISLDESESQIYTVNGFMMYRTRFKLKHVNFEGLHEGVRQPNYDRLGQSNYCDFGEYHDLNFRRIKRAGLTLYNADITSIKRITEHDILPTFEHVIKLTNGGGISVENIHHAMHGITDGSGIFLPRNDGSGVEGEKALIKLVGVDGVTIKGTYIERQFGDYMFLLENANNVSIDNHYERFIGNGFTVFKGSNKNISFNNIYRHANMLDEYYDFYKKTGSIISNIDIRNMVSENWFNESVNLTRTDWRNINFTSASNVYRNNKSTFSESDMNLRVNSEQLTLYITYLIAESKFIIEDRVGTRLDAILGNPVWDTDGIRLNATKLYPFRIESVSPVYYSASVLPYLPVIRKGVDKIQFMNIATQARVSAPDDKMVFALTLNTLLNKKLIS